MKISRKNAGTGLRSLIRQGGKPSFIKHLSAKALESAYQYDVRQKSIIPAISPNDPRLQWAGEIGLQYEMKAGNTSILEQYLLVSVMKQRACKTFFEIGTFDGQTAYALARNCADMKIFTLDLPATESESTALGVSEGEKRYIKKPVIGAKFLGTPEAARITQLLGDSATFDYSPYAAKMDAIFIDGSHDYVYVKNDTEKCLPLLSDHGVMLWHDYLTYDSVTKYLEELAKTLPLFWIQGTALVVHFKN